MIRTSAAAVAALVLATALSAPLPTRAEVSAPVDAGPETASDAASPDGWWRRFGDPELDRLVAASLSENRDLRAARANVEAARALAGEARTRLLPAGQLEAGRSRVRQSAAADPLGQSLGAPLPTQSLSDYGVALRWELDLFGGVRAAGSAARAEAGAADWERRRVEAGVVAQVVRAYLDRAAADGLAARTRTRIAALEDVVARLQQATALGALPSDRLDEALAALESARAERPRLEAAARAATRRLAVLTGRAPEDVAPTAFTLPEPPVALAVSSLAEALRRRPDVGIAESRLAAAAARVKLETAALYPRITLFAGAGRTGPSGAIDSAPALRFGYGPQLSWGLFDLAATRARIGAAGAGAEAALAAWEGATLQALEEAEGALDAYASARAVAASADAAAAAAGRGEAAVRARFEVGAAAALDLSRARAQAVAVEAAAFDAQAAVARAWIEAHLALGAGWSDSDAAPAP